MIDPLEAMLLRAEIDAVLADWAWHLDHGDYAAVAGLFTEDALFVTGAVELRGRSAIEKRYTEREHVRTTRHTYSGLRVSVPDDDPVFGGPESGAGALAAKLTQVERAWTRAGRPSAAEPGPGRESPAAGLTRKPL